MLTFPKSISDPAAAPVASFTSNPTKTILAKPSDAQSGSFASALKALSGGTGASSAASGAGSTGAAPAAAGSTLGSENDVSEDKFLTLLVAQMRNQDPLNPLDNAEVTSQLAQINTVRGIDKLNTSMASLVQSLGAQDTLRGAELIGRDVLVEGDKLKIGDSADTSRLAAGFELPASAADVKVQVLDEAGDPVTELAMGALPAGVHPFTWDGRNADGRAQGTGTYSFRVSASNDKEQVAAVTLANARVTSVTRSAQGYDIQLDSGASVASDSVRGVR